MKHLTSDILKIPEYFGVLFFSFFYVYKRIKKSFIPTEFKRNNGSLPQLNKFTFMECSYCHGVFGWSYSKHFHQSNEYSVQIKRNCDC